MILSADGVLRSGRRVACFALGILAIVVSLRFWAEREPEAAVRLLGRGAVLLGPSASRLHQSAGRRMQAGVAALSEVNEDPARRLAEFSRHMEAARALLEASLRADPSPARVWADLAAVRFELEPERPLEEQLALIAHAGSLAPNSGSVQLRLGRLLLGMGQREAAHDYLRRSAASSASRMEEVVQLLHDSLFTLDEIVALVPDRARVLSLLEGAFRAEGRSGEYLDHVEPLLPAAPPELIRAFGDACMREGVAERLLEALAMRVPSPDSEAVQVEVTLQRSRAHLRLRQIDAALHDAELLRRLRPEDARILEHVGYIAAAADRPDAAIEALRSALRILSAQRATAPRLARVYRQIGQAEEARRSPDRAYDAYRRALDLDPDETESRRRLSEMEAATRRPVR